MLSLFEGDLRNKAQNRLGSKSGTRMHEITQASSLSRVWFEGKLPTLILPAVDRQKQTNVGMCHFLLSLAPLQMA